MQFKTNISGKESAEALFSKLKERFPDAELNLEEESADKVLHVHGIPEDSEHAARVESAIKESGFEGSWLTRGEENK